ncbi:gluconokinase [Oleiharenicola lentus]|uniref:Gluconokinase n=2 Tax=Oleiharenicola lentus TaxID=2508720 RepID=A0A4V1M6X3_9BACT|nr:gluconokinase [Oleiharenicola lentus]
MGVAGSGKTTLGRQLAADLGWAYHEADDFHSAANKDKMARGIPLDDTDRAPWLAAIRAAMDTALASGRPAVFTCSALKAAYRRILLDGLKEVALVHLTGDPALLLARIQGRAGHYMKPEMLASQLATLEAPADALTLDIARSPAELVAEIRRRLTL